MFKSILCAAVFGLAACSASSGTETSTEIDRKSNGNVVIKGGVITTLNAANDTAQALAFDQSGKIIAVGTVAETEEAAGLGATIISLKGGQVLPGFQDVHLHAVEAGVNENRCLLSEFGTLRDYKSEISDCAEDQSSAPWFIGAGVSMPDLLGLTERPADFLDGLIPHKPALILDNLGHGAWANSKALQAVGYNVLKGNPQGGIIDRGANGAPSGVVYENAQQALRNAALPANEVNDQANYNGLLLALTSLAENGSTSISDAGGYWPRGQQQAWSRAEAEKRLTVRASNAFYVYPDRDVDQQIADITALKSQGEYVRFDQVKIYVDGIISQGTAKLKAPYTNDPDIADVGPAGFEYFDRTDLTRYAIAFDAAGFSLHFHATGDHGVTLGLDAIEDARKANGKTRNRHRITHLFMVDPSDIPRFAELGVTADLQVTPTSISAETLTFYRGLIGDRADRVIPVKSLLDSGANVTLSSDWDADELNPLIKIEQAVSRATGEAIPDVLTALRMAIINPAILLGHDDVTGTLEVGKRADLVILDKNILLITKSQIDDTKIIATIFDGKVVYDPNGIFE